MDQHYSVKRLSPRLVITTLTLKRYQYFSGIFNRLISKVYFVRFYMCGFNIKFPVENYIRFAKLQLLSDVYFYFLFR